MPSMVFGGFCVLGGNTMATEGFKRKLTAVFCADVFGYNRLLGEADDATVRTVKGHLKLPPLSLASIREESSIRLAIICLLNLKVSCKQ